MGRKKTPDQRADRLASRQHAAISRHQALDAGLTDNQIDGRLASERWLAIVRGVFVVTGAPRAWQQDAMVACLAGPKGTVASHETAAALFGLADPPAAPQVTVPRWASGRFDLAEVHRSRLPLDRRDVCTAKSVPCTTPARTLVDCAALFEYEQLCELVDTALCRRLTRVTAVRATMARSARAHGRKGLPLLERALEVWDSGPRPGSPAEMKLLRLLENWGFPRPVRQFVIRDERGRFVGRIDLSWPERRRGFEYDGQEFHGPRRKPADAARQQRMEALGWTIERVGKYDLRPPAAELWARVTALFATPAAA
jgi:hypothetical protein